MKKSRRILSLLVVVSLLLGMGIMAPQVAVADSAPGNIELSRTAATEGMVLLKNDNSALPIAENGTVAILGKAQIGFIKGGGGSGDVTAEYVTNLLQGMQDKKVQINQALAKNYSEKLNSNKDDSTYRPTQAEVTAAAATSDTAVVVIKRYSNEGNDRSTGKGDYLLSDEETELLRFVKNANFKKVVVVLNIGGIIDTSWINDDIDSVLIAWQPGMEGGAAAADILCGDVNPSGKLSDTFAKSYNDYLSSAGYFENVHYVNYTDDIFVGYRNFETFDPTYSKVNYEFGFGLSYTTFDITNVTTAVKDGTVTVKATVKNTGAVAGKEVVQVYFSAPQGLLGKPGKELAAFAKTKLLAPGKSETLTMTYAVNDMSSYDDTGKTDKKSAYVLEAGDYKIYVGNSIKNAGVNGVRYTHTVSALTVTEQLSEQVAPIQLEKRLLADGSYENLETLKGVGIPVSGTAATTIQATDYFKKHYHAFNVFDVNNNYDPAMYLENSNAGENDKHNKFLTYAIDVKTAGKYYVYLNVGSEQAYADAVRVYIDEVRVQGLPALNVPATKGLYKYKRMEPIELNLKAGKQFIKFEFARRSEIEGTARYDEHIKFNVKSILFQPGTPLEPEPATYIPVKAAGVNKIEAEDESSEAGGGNNIASEPITTGPDKGGTSMMGLDLGAWLSYNLDVEQAGEYTLTLRAASDRVRNNCISVLVGGVKQDGIIVNMTDTQTPGNQWFGFADYSVTVNLPAGKTVLRFEFNQFGNFDYFTLTNTINTIYSLAKPVSAVLQDSSAKSDPTEIIKFTDYLNDNSLLDNFLAQLSIYELAELGHGHGSRYPGAEGVIGGGDELEMKYGIPNAETVDGPAGINYSVACTAWPIATLIACTWDVDLAEQIGKAAAVEAKLNGMNVWLAPGLNIHRNPLCGRNFEYYSEDPLLSGKMAAAMTKGSQSEKVAVAIKHFAANNKETQRGYSDSRMSERAMREIYLKGFEITVKEADPWTVMSSYNNLNGKETSESYELLTGILRDEWGFKGLVMSDWWNDSIAWREVFAGNDVKMASGDTPNVLGAYENGWITREDLVRNAKRVMKLLMLTDAIQNIRKPIVHEIAPTGANRILAIDNTYKHSNVSSEDCKDVGGGFNTTNTWNGRWMTYVVNVEKAGIYGIKARVAGGGGDADLLIDDEKVGYFKSNAAGKDWQEWVTTTADYTVALPAGQSYLKMLFLGDSVNLNWIELTRLETKFGVTISGNREMNTGTQQKMTVSVTANGSTQAGATLWTLSKNTSAATVIGADGTLTIGADEKSSTIMVKAVISNDTDSFDTFNVTVNRVANQIESTVYTVDQTNKIIKKVSSKSTVAQFKANVSPDVIVYAANGTTVAADTAKMNGKMTVKAVNGTDTYDIWVIGDVNDDGELDSADITQVINAMTGKATDIALIERANVNGDTELDIADISALVNLLVGR